MPNTKRTLFRKSNREIITRDKFRLLRWMFIDPRSQLTENSSFVESSESHIAEIPCRSLRLYHIIRYNRDVIGFICGTTRARNSPVAAPPPDSPRNSSSSGPSLEIHAFAPLSPPSLAPRHFSPYRKLSKALFSMNLSTTRSPPASCKHAKQLCWKFSLCPRAL